MNVLFFTPNFNYACGRSYYIYSLMKSIKGYSFKPILVTNKGDSLDRVEEINVPYIINNKFFKRNLYSVLYQKKLLSEILIKYDIDIIHTCHRYAEFISLQALKHVKNKKISTVFTALSEYSNRYYFEFKSDVIIGISNKVIGNLISNYGVNSEKICKIPNFVIEEPKEMKPAILNNDSIFKLLSVSRFHKDKGIKTIIGAMKLLKYQDIHLTLVGDGELEGYISAKVKKYNLNISIIGPQKYLRSYYMNADLCVSTSFVDPFPTFMLQSGLYGCPFIGSNISGINELIVDGVNGFLFPPNDYESLAGKILFLKNNQDSLNRVSWNLNRIVKSQYTDNNIIPQIINIYKNIIRD